MRKLAAALLIAGALALPGVANAACTILTGGLGLGKPAIGDNWPTWSVCLRDDIQNINDNAASTTTLAASTATIWVQLDALAISTTALELSTQTLRIEVDALWLSTESLQLQIDSNDVELAQLGIDTAALYNQLLTVAADTTTLFTDKLARDGSQAMTGPLTISGSSLTVGGDALVQGTLDVDSTTINGVAYTWPNADGTLNQRLTTNGSGGLSWATVSGGGGGHTLATGTYQGASSAFTARSTAVFDSAYFTLQDDATGDATFISLPTGASNDVWTVKATHSVTAVTSATFDNLESDKYYKVIFAFVQNTSDALFSVRTNGDSSANYNSIGRAQFTNGTTLDFGGAGLTSCYITEDGPGNYHKAAKPLSGEFTFSTIPTASATRHIYGKGGMVETSVPIFGRTTWSCEHNGSGDLTSITILASAGNFTGTLKLLELAPTRTAAISVPASTQTVIPETTITAQQDPATTCVAGSTITLTTNGGDVYIAFAGAGIGNAVYSTFLNVLRDGQRLSDFSNQSGITGVSWPASGYLMNLSFSVTDKSPSSGSHSYCLAASNNAGGFSTTLLNRTSNGTGMTFSAQEVRNVAGTGDVATNADNTFTGANDFQGTTSIAVTCPAGFTKVVSNSRVLGCMQTAEEGNAAFNVANENCFDTYGGRVPFSGEIQIAFENYALTDETDAPEWVGEVAPVVTQGDHAYIVFNSGLYASNSKQYTSATDYRCWIPAASMLAQ